MTDPRRAIPAIDELIAAEAFASLLAERPRARVVAALRGVQAELRQALGEGELTAVPDDPGWYAERAAGWLEAQDRPSLRAVINATGVVLHTNLGRAPLAGAAREAMARVAASYSNLEYDLEAGGRGSRYAHCTAIQRALTGAEAALVVNNNAAAVVLVLNTLAEGRDAVISRGELVEIGGSFRVPEIMARSGCRMVEVGATNRTHLADYEAATGGDTGVILKVHRSNFRVTGFTAEADIEALAGLAAERNIPLVNDLGSGLLLGLEAAGLTGEPTAGEALAAGADVVTMSGDKLLGGPQAGIVLGRAELVERMRRNPLCRALRVDKLTLAGLEATLMLYRDPDRARAEVPVLRMLHAAPAALERRAERLAEALEAAGIAAGTRAGASAVGGGAFPGAELPTTLVAIRSDAPADALHRRLREGDPPVIGRVLDDRLVLDPRTIAPDEEDAVVAALVAAHA